jgi:hypothetical protein
MQEAPDTMDSTTRADIKQAFDSSRTLRMTSTKEVRAFLSDLNLRPLSQREFLCRLLKSAAAVHAAAKDSAVYPADTHHKSTS